MEAATLEDVRGLKGTVVMFICNHCPFVKHVNAELVRIANPVLTGTAALRLDAGPVKAVRDCLREHLAVLGLFENVGGAAIPAEIEDLARQRDEARAARDFARADELRDQITAAGFRIEDTPDGTKVRTS